MPTLDQLSDRAELTDLVARLGRWLDAGAEGDAADVLDAAVTATTPGGRAEGREAVVAQARANHDVPTLHQITDVLVDLDGDRAVIGAAVTATFAGDGATGGRYALRAARTREGWRLTEIAMQPVYRRGV
jgi:SnoaL-like domain